MTALEEYTANRPDSKAWVGVWTDGTPVALVRRELADAAIAELQAENTRLKAELETLHMKLACMEPNKTEAACLALADKLAHEEESNHISIAQWTVWEERAKQAEAEVDRHYSLLTEERNRVSELQAEVKKWKLLADERWDMAKHESEQRNKAEAERNRWWDACKKYEAEVERLNWMLDAAVEHIAVALCATQEELLLTLSARYEEM